MARGEIVARRMRVGWGRERKDGGVERWGSESNRKQTDTGEDWCGDGLVTGGIV